MKKSRVSSARGARAGKNDQGMKSKKISDIPELSDTAFVHAPGRSTHSGRGTEKADRDPIGRKGVAWLRTTAEKKGLRYQS